MEARHGYAGLLSHHYFDLDAEAVYAVCETHIPELIQTIWGILADLDA
jgi:uncharacterized protein with HEPN domain